jgi:hypothetical protein
MNAKIIAWKTPGIVTSIISSINAGSKKRRSTRIHVATVSKFFVKMPLIMVRITIRRRIA